MTELRERELKETRDLGEVDLRPNKLEIRNLCEVILKSP